MTTVAAQVVAGGLNACNDACANPSPACSIPCCSNALCRTPCTIGPHRLALTAVCCNTNSAYPAPIAYILLCARQAATPAFDNSCGNTLQPCSQSMCRPHLRWCRTSTWRGACKFAQGSLAAGSPACGPQGSLLATVCQRYLLPPLMLHLQALGQS